MENRPETFNYCHDSEIAKMGEIIGIRDVNLLNTAFSIGEGAYNSQDVAEKWLEEQRQLRKVRLPKSRLSKKQKAAIFARHGLNY